MLRLRLLGFCVVVAAPACAQSGTVDIYEKFIGQWRGTSTVLRDGKMIHYAVDLDVTEEVEKNRIRMIYSYADSTPSVDVRFIRLWPRKERMERLYPHESTEDFKTTGLKEFASSGSGSFIALRMATAEDPMGISMRVKFHVENGLLEYEWQRSTNGRDYSTYSLWSHRR